MNMILGLGINSPIKQRCLMQTLNIGGRLKCSRRDIAQKWEGRNDYQGASL